MWIGNVGYQPAVFRCFSENYQRATARERQKPWVPASPRSERTAALVAVLRCFSLVPVHETSAALIARAPRGGIEIRINPLKFRDPTSKSRKYQAGAGGSATASGIGRVPQLSKIN
jgi:hypothetical protein